MTTLFFILIIFCAAVLGFIILVQNPKGGGLAGSIGGFSNQLMGVKQTNDVLEKGTWIFSSLIAILCLFSTFFMSGSTSSNNVLDQINTNQQATPSQPTAPQSTPPVTPAP